LNPGTAVIVNLLGGVALLLWGVRMVRTGVMRAWGDRLRNFIEHRAGNRLSAFLAGGLATAILGSGTAMTLIVAGLAAAGAIGTPLGLAVLLGADVGSAIVSALFASGSNLALWASPMLLFAGYVIHASSAEPRPHNAGRVLIGLGLMLLALTLIKQASAPLSTTTLFHDVLEAVGREAFLAFLIGAALTWAFHSSLAVILLIVSFVANGSLSEGAAFAFILGINFGGGLPAVSATLGQPPAARRLPLANLICRGLAAILCLAFLGRIAPLAEALPFGPIETAVAFHAAFNILVGIVFLPLTGVMSGLMEKLLPEDPGERDRLARPRHLDSKPATPAVALANVLLETVRMTELLESMFDTALDALRAGSTGMLKQLKPMDARLNAYQTQLQAYLAELARQPVTPEESRRALELTLYISNLEHAGDVIQLNLADRIEAKLSEGISFTEGEMASLGNLSRIIHDNLKLASAVLSSGDVEGARHLISQKDAFRELQNEVLDKHFRAGALGRGEALRRSALYVDIIRDLNRINALVVSAGYPIADAAGLLRGSRLRQAE
jgi:phosphate:Na+ symporter